MRRPLRRTGVFAGAPRNARISRTVVISRPSRSVRPQPDRKIPSMPANTRQSGSDLGFTGYTACPNHLSVFLPERFRCFCSWGGRSRRVLRLKPRETTGRLLGVSPLRARREPFPRSARVARPAGGKCRRQGIKPFLGTLRKGSQAWRRGSTCRRRRSFKCTGPETWYRCPSTNAGAVKVAVGGVNVTSNNAAAEIPETETI